MSEYDATDDAVKSYYAAIAAKKARGDTTYPPAPEPKQEALL